MTIEITRDEQANILRALRAAQDAIRDVYHSVRDRSGEHDPHHPMLNQLYALRDSLIGLERPVQGLDTV